MKVLKWEILLRSSPGPKEGLKTIFLPLLYKSSNSSRDLSSREELPEEVPEEPEDILPEIMESEELDFESAELLEKEEEHLEEEIISPPEVEV